MKRIGLCGIVAMVWLLTTIMPMTVHGEIAPPKWQADWELDHESDSLANVHTESTKPADMGLAMAILAGFAGCMILASQRIRASKTGGNNRPDI